MSLHRLPRSTPPVALLLADLAGPDAATLARIFDVSERCVYRWKAHDTWPRAVRISLFFASRYGWSAVQSDALLALHTAHALQAALRDELQRAQMDIAALQRALDTAETGAANVPVMIAR